MIYSKEKAKKKVDKIIELYPTVDWADLAELLPQIMEVVEITAIVRKANEVQKKEAAIMIMNDLVERVGVDQNMAKVIPKLWDVINDASKGRFAINRSQE